MAEIKNTAGAPEHLHEQAKQHVARVPNPPQASMAYRAQTVYRALLEGGQMPDAWQRLAAVVNTKKFSGQYAVIARQQGDYGYEVFRAVMRADSPNRVIDLTPAARKRDKALVVAKAARELIAAMEDTIDWGYFQALNLWMGEDDTRRKMLTRLLGKEPLIVSVDLGLAGEELNFSEVFRALLDDAEKIAAEPPIVDETASPRPALVSFVRKFGGDMVRLFGKPLDAVTAAIVTELFGDMMRGGDAMSDNQVRDMRRPKRSI